MRQAFDRVNSLLDMPVAPAGAYPPGIGSRLITHGKNKDIFKDRAEKFAG
jgi:hypothetical protein